MPINHGLYRNLSMRRQGEPLMSFRYGIGRCFDAFRTNGVYTDQAKREKAARLQHHFLEVTTRLVYSLQQLNTLAQDLAIGMSIDSLSPRSMELTLRAECFAEHALNYLGIFVDDIAIMTALLLDCDPAKPVDSMGALRSNQAHKALRPIRPLMDHLATPNSWWGKGFLQGRGARQLLVHRQGLVKIQFAQASNKPLEAQAFLMTPLETTQLPFHEYFGLIREILTDMFDWLDRLDAELAKNIGTRVSGWRSPVHPWALPLPVGYPAGITRYEGEYFPIPLCDGSEPLPWSIEIEV